MFPIDYIPAADIVGLVGCVMLLATLMAGALCVRALLGSGKGKKKPPRRPGPIGAVIIGLLLLVFLSFSVSLLMFSLVLRTHGVLDVRDPVAVVSCREVAGEAAFDLIMEYTPEGGEPRTLLLRGDQWMVEGYVIEFDGRLALLGVTSGYRVVRIRGRYTDPADETSYPPTIYSLTDERWNEVWRYLMEEGDRLPLVEAVYGNAVFAYPDEDDSFVIYVTSNGFTLSRFEETP